MIVFADTSALVSLFNPDDLNHDRAKKLSMKLSVGLNSCLYSKYIFAETVTILSQKVGKEKAVYAGELMKKRFQEIRVDEDAEKLAWEIFKKHISKNISFVDCTIIALYQKGAFDKCFTFDQHLKSNRVSLLG